MDFALSEEQEAVRDLAARIVADHATPERLKEVEAGADWFDRKLWADLAEAGLLGIAVPESDGGTGLSILELCLVLAEVGRRVAPVPAVATLAFGALPVARLGTDDQRRRLLPGVVAGDIILTGAFADDEPTTAEPAGDRWRLRGTKICVPAAELAERIVVPAAADDGTVIVLLDPRAAGVSVARDVATNGEPQARVELDGVTVERGDVLAGPDRGATALASVLDHALVALCAVQSGVIEEALRMTAEYTSGREQFGRPIATFQAVGQRAADAFIDTLAVRLTMLQAAWRLGEGLPASEEVAVAKFWAADAGQRVVAAAQHLHGGIGVDVDYPLHRYTLWAKNLEVMLGGATPHLVRLGRMMAAAG